ncbi:alpha/beta hydrolase [Thalassomonas viridans]|uniref:Alpha/beta hydrolase n=1 Tax=Thalassomonas viridans TaxID=137584 RepID=A0AAE9Z973_9GAMM|nr:alpha/beta hydrolase [Thalassomonas viridans]WDE08838.1 alpha/beta hydrolase [Thalassomonas viridans]
MNVRIFLLIALISLGTSAKEADLKPTISGLFDVGGFNLYLECFQHQNSKPQLIIESGFGLWGSDGVWLENIERLKNDFNVCLYDRSGLGKSESGPVPFTVNNMANWLRNLLQTADIKPPYYFAGHSYDSYIINSYNNQFPDEVLGAVLIDPAPFGFFYTMAIRWPKDFKTENKQLRRQMNFELTVRNPLFERVPEKVDLMKSYQELSNAVSFGDKPVITLRSKQNGERFDSPDVPDDIARKMDKLFDNADSYFKGLSNNSQVFYSNSKKHNLHIHDSDLVVESIKKLLRK